MRIFFRDLHERLDFRQRIDLTIGKLYEVEDELNDIGKAFKAVERLESAIIPLSLDKINFAISTLESMQMFLENQLEEIIKKKAGE